MALFLDVTPEFEKRAAVARLSDDPAKWGREITTELYRYVPYLNKYSVEVRVDRVDPERGFGMGAAIIANRTSRSEVEALQGGQINYSRIPIIIKGGMLEPFDVFLYNGEVIPLTEDRFSIAMFRPEMFDAVRPPPASPSLVNQLFPPTNFRHGLLGGGGEAGAGDIGKTGSVNLEAILAEGADHGLPTLRKVASAVRESDLRRFFENLIDPGTKVAAQGNPHFLEAVEVLGEASIWSEKTASAREATLKALLVPDVIQLSKLADGNVLLKMANSQMFDQEETEINVVEAVNLCGRVAVEKLAERGHVTMTKTERSDGADKEMPKVASAFGDYAVGSADGASQHRGVVFPQIYDFDLNEIPMALFTNRDHMGLQEKIAGFQMEMKVDQFLSTREPESGDFGTFVFADDVGGLRATMPIKVASVSRDQSGVPTLHASDDWGRKLDITPSPGLVSIEKVGQVDDVLHYVIPNTLRFLPLPETRVQLQGEPELFDKMGQAGVDYVYSLIKIGCDRTNTVSLDGIPLRPLPEEKRAFIDIPQAEFILVCAGVSPEVAQTKLAEAKRFGSSEVRGANEVVPYMQKNAEAISNAAEMLGHLPTIKQVLIKEAATIPDAATVDSLLSLNFVTPENMYLFSEALPQFEATQRRIAELLLASRVGLPLPTGALEKAMHFLEEVLLALKAMSGGVTGGAAAI